MKVFTNSEQPPRPGSDPDAELVRTAARRVAWQITVACAVVVVIVALTAFILGPVLHPSRAPHPEDFGGFHGEEDNDALFRNALVIAGVTGVIIAGLIGVLGARWAVAPLSRALALQRRFVADAGHELRTPLTVLHTRAQLIARRIDQADPARPMVQALLADSRVLGEIVDEMLESAALGGHPTGGDLLELDGVAVDVVGSMQVLADQAGVALRVERPATESDSAAGPAPLAQVRGSASALRRAVTALVDNALSHTPEGGHVMVAVARQGDRVVVSVVDDGHGLAGADAGRLTERFARGAGSPGGVGGSRRFGLGLALVREVAAAHGGEFALVDLPGAGVRAAISLPAGHVAHPVVRS